MGSTAEPAAARIRVLGPVEAIGPGGPASLVGARQRAVVGVLAVKAGTLVPQWRLIDALWGDNPPRTATKSLHSHVARVRQALDGCGLSGVLVTRDTGYLLAIPADAVDAHRFEELARQGQRELLAGEPARAAARLRDGLALWRDEVALADAGPRGWAAAEVERLTEACLTAHAARWEAELGVGRHVEAVAELERLLVAYPLREGLVGSLMLALYRCGRHTAALEAFQRLRARLADELGVDPGPELIRLHGQVLRRDPALDWHPVDIAPATAVGPRTSTGQPSADPRAAAPRPTPSRPDEGRDGGRAGVHRAAAGPPLPRPVQLPALVGHFTGRGAELARLDRLVDNPDADTRVAVISGPGGGGKTALAVQWAYRMSDRFPDGQLFVDLRGHEPESQVSAEDALSRLLRSLGVSAGHVPTELAEQAALFRSLLHDRRMLIVADNAGSTDAVLPLVPAGAANLLVVTSRQALPALSTHHAVCSIPLDVLSEQESLVLLRRLLGDPVVDTQSQPARELVRLCGRIPLALRIAAAKLAGRPASAITELVVELTAGDRLDVLAVDGDSRSVRAVFASAYRALSPPAARMFRLLGLSPGASFHVDLGAAMAGMTPGEARPLVAELAAAHLAVADGAHRYRFHDLIAVFAASCAADDEPEPDRAAAVARLVDWYLAVAHAANRVVDPGRDRVAPVLLHPPVELPFAAEPMAALAFLDGERENLLPVARFCTEQGHLTATWQLTYLLTGFYDSRGDRAQRVDMCREGVSAARRAGDPVAEGLMRSGLGIACVAAHRFEEALESLHAALPLMRACGDHRGEGHAYNNIAAAHSGLRQFDQAMGAFRQALAIHTANRYPVGIALALNNAGHTAVRMGRPELGMDDLRAALRLSREIGIARLEAAALHSIGEADLHRGEPAAALGHFAAALALYRHMGDRRYEAETLNGIGLAHLALGQPGEALAVLDQALEASVAIPDQHLTAVVVHHIGRCRLAADDLPGAEEQFRYALELRTQAPDAYEEARLKDDLAALATRRRDSGRDPGQAEVPPPRPRSPASAEEAGPATAPAGSRPG